MRMELQETAEKTCQKTLRNLHCDMKETNGCGEERS